MNTGQMLLTPGAMLLMAVVVVNVNRALTENDDFLNQTRFGLEEISIATSIIEEASQMPFDEVSWDSTKVEKKVSDFTIRNNFGTDAGESTKETFDDFDDFHNYVKAETTAQNIYNIRCSVDYVQSSQPDQVSIGRSYTKRLRVIVTTPINQDSLKLNYVHGYWYFN